MNTGSIFFKYRLNHIIAWAVVFAAWYFLRYQDYSTRERAFLVTLVKVLDLALMIYLANLVLIPRLLYRKRYAWFALAFVVMIVGSSYVKMQIIGNILNNPRLFDLGTNLKARVYDNVIPHFFLVIAGMAIKLLYDHSRMQKRLIEMAREKAEAELNFLKSQINPHFLFNSLNAVYFLINKENAEARKALHKFSDMLRYQLYEMNGAKIPVEKEVAYLKDYVDLQKLRKDKQYHVEFNCDPSVQGFLIEPLLLIPFVENAFKHISHHTEKENYVRVGLCRENGSLHFSVENSKEAMRTTEQGGGIGLSNVRRRLELLYPGKHELKIGQTPGDFSVKLKLEV